MFQSLRQKHPFFSYYLFCVILILFYSIKVRLARKRQMFPNCSSSLFALSVLYYSSLYADKNADSEHNTERGRASNFPCVFSLSPESNLASLPQVHAFLQECQFLQTTGQIPPSRKPYRYRSCLRIISLPQQYSFNSLRYWDWSKTPGALAR